MDTQQENARKSEAVKNAVQTAANGSDLEIKTGEYNVNPQQDYYSGKLPKILGYEVKNTVVVSINRLEQVGAVVDAATAAGANSVDGIRYIVGEASPAQGDALSIAAKQAIAKAEAIAKTMNGHIVRVLQADEGGLPGRPNDEAQYSSVMSMNANAATKPMVRTPLEAGSLTVHAQVVVVAEVAF